tara:strand:- start:49 stop:234 length:186 start_codon:yes stop_codon:yes gene_type:complete
MFDSDINTDNPANDILPMSKDANSARAALPVDSFQKFNSNPTNVNIHTRINDVSIVINTDL